MQAASLPSNEAERLASLRALDVLDSAPETEFDALVSIASGICDAPIALITLVDAHRQWFKARSGLRGPSETPRDVAFCAHAILDGEFFSVADAAADPRFHDNPLVTGEPGIRFYAAAPLTLRDGTRAGTLCVIDRRPRTLDPRQCEALRQLAVVASRALENRQARLALAAERRRMAGILEGSDVGTWEWNAQTGETRLNERAAQILGQSLAQFGALSIDAWFARMHPDDVERSSALLARCLAGESSAYECEARMRHRDGSWVWVVARAKVTTHTADGRPEWVFGTFLDITELKHASLNAERSSEELRRLSASLTHSREAERRHLARELHDELGQRLVALKMDLAALPAHRAVPQLLAAVDGVIGATRRIAADLRPAMLDDLGLDAALEWLADDWRRRTGLSITIDTDHVAGAVNEAAAITVYRIVQEALTNVMRHAQATRVHITLRLTTTELVVTVADDGRGIEDADMGKRGSSGLVGMRERARLHGGVATIDNHDKGGCRVAVRLPMHRVDSGHGALDDGAR